MRVQGRRTLITICTIATLVALALRLHFVMQVRAEWRALPYDLAHDGQHGFLNPDSPSYLTPASALLSGDIAGAGNLARPPGYPIFLALSGVRFLPILLAQAFVSALIPACVILLVHLLTGRIALAGLAAIPAVVSPTGIGLSAMVLADLLLSALFAAGLLLLAAGARWRRPGFLLAAGATFGAAALVKPILLLWAPVSLVVLWLFGGLTTLFPRRRTPALFVALQLLPQLGWALRNYAADGVFTLSSIGTITMRVYLAARAEAWVEVGHSPPDSVTRRKQLEVRQRFRADSGPIAEKLRWYRAETREIARAHPRVMLQTYLTNVLESLRRGWTFAPRQLTPGRAVTSFYLSAAKVEGFARTLVPWLFGLAILITAFAWRTSATAESRQHFLDVVALCLVWGYFVVLGGITFRTGTRLLFPTQSAVVAASLVGACAVLALRQHRRVGP